MYAGTSGFAFLQNINDGGQPIAIFNSLNLPCEFFRDVDIQNHYDRNRIDNLIANIGFSNYYNKTKLNTTVANQTYIKS